MQIFKFFTLIFLAFPIRSYAIVFESISVDQPIKLTISSNIPQLASFHLKMSLVQFPHLFIKVVYIIDKDTLTDYHYLDQKFEGIIKEINISKGATITALLYLHTNGIPKLDSIKGEFNYKLSSSKEPEEIEGTRKFVGSIWSSTEQVLFKINKPETEKQKLMLVIKTTENFTYDKLYLKIKAVSPADGIQLINKAITVNSTEYLDYSGKILSITMDEFKMNKEGNYYIQIMHEMLPQRLNGIESISFKIVKD